MTPLTIRPAAAADLPALAGIYQKARAFMAAHGNPTQWGSTNPPPETLRQDIARGQLFVLCEGNTPHAAFATAQSMEKRAVLVCENLRAWLDGAPIHLV